MNIRYYIYIKLKYLFKNVYIIFFSNQTIFTRKQIQHQRRVKFKLKKKLQKKLYNWRPIKIKSWIWLKIWKLVSNSYVDFSTVITLWRALLWSNFAKELFGKAKSVFGIRVLFICTNGSPEFFKGFDVLKIIFYIFLNVQKKSSSS